MINHSDYPEIYPSINHQLLDEAIKNGLDTSKYMGTVPLSEVPSYEGLEDKESK